MTREIRRKDRTVFEKEQIEEIVKEAKVLHLGLMDGVYPYVIPMHYGYVYDREGDCYVFYMHSAREGHKLDVIRSNGHACLVLETGTELELGGEIPCQYGAFYASFLGRGTVSIVEEREEQKQALKLLMLNQTGKSFEFTEEMASSVAVIKAEIRDYTAKARRKNT